MKQIQVNASQNYLVHVGHGLLAEAGDTIRNVTKASRVCIVSDNHVWPLYGKTVTESLTNSGLKYVSFVFPAGETSKNANNYIQLLNFCAENGITRSDCIIALGGGVVGDLAGFAAASYLRGISYIQIPTTLLAMVDSSVGGKTGIDLPAGKNLCGAFWQPAAVLCDLDTLNSLPKENFQDGCAEVIKYAILFDPELFDHLETQGLGFHQEDVVARCITHKRDVVEQDELDKGQRMLLNLGHTLGHAIEHCSEYSISHGKAVAIGMAMVSNASKCPDTDRILALLDAFGLPTKTDFTVQQLLQAALMDKKRSADQIHLILPACVGNCRIVPMGMAQLETFIEEGI